MGQLVSPGVQISVIDQSFFAPGAPGTVPLIFIATADNKAHIDGNGIAEGTLPENAGVLYLITSQRELLETFGSPTFVNIQGTPQHGNELNEYGLWAAWSFFGIANRAYVIRASVNTAQLEPSQFEPRGEPLSGTYWLDTTETEWGIFSSNGNSVPGLAWGARTPFVIDTLLEVDTVVLGTQGFVNPAAAGAISTPGGSLIIDGTTVTLNPGDSLDDVVTAINAASIPNVEATAFRYVGQSFLLLRNGTGDFIDVDNTSAPSVLADLGIGAPADQLRTPKSSIGFDGDFAVVTLTNDTGISDLVVFQKLTPQAEDGSPDPLASTFWFPVGSESWKAATPTVVIGATSPAEIDVGDQLVLGDGINTTTITFTTSGASSTPGKQTLAETVADINAGLGAVDLFVTAPGGNYILISNIRGEDVEISEPASSNVMAPLGITPKDGNRLFYDTAIAFPAGSTAGDVWIKTTEPNKGAKYSIKLYSRSTGQFSTITAPLYENDDIATDVNGPNAAAGTLYVQYNVYGSPADPVASHVIKRYRGFSETEVLGSVINPTVSSGDSFVITAGQPGGGTASGTVTVVGTDAASVVQAINNAAIPNIKAQVLTDKVRILNSAGYSITIDAGSGTILDDIGIFEGTYSNWEFLAYEAGSQEPTTEAPEGTLWYNPNFRVDVMVNDGDEWMGYRNMYPNTDPNGVQIAGSPPLTQTDGTPLQENDLWIDGTQLDDYPAIYRWSTSMSRWVKIDKAEQSDPSGIVFADARQNANGQEDGSELIADMLVSNYVDPDAPDPRTFPAGLLLFNMRYSTYNVKEWRPNYFEEFVGQVSDTFPGAQYNVGNATFPINTIDTDNIGRWVTVSGLRPDGSPYMGRFAQRQMIVQALASAIVSNEDARAETVFFNLIACPGYPELIEEMIVLNTDKKEVAFILGDTPLRLRPSGNAINDWATNANQAPSTGETGLTVANTYVGLWYPWGLGTNIDGQEVVIPPSAVMLRVIVNNDFVAYPWFAPAGYNRGIVTNAASFGYLDDEDEYRVTFLNQGQRDVLYLNNINPITFIERRGWVILGQKTLHPVASALDRINVVRLINYLRYNFDIIAKPFLFEPSDEITWDAARAVFENLLANVQGLRGVGDFVVQVDSGNNTPDRIDRNELWIDVAIEPIRAIEFIYIPIRVVNTGEL